MESSLCLRMICIIIFFLVQYSTASSFVNYKNMSMNNITHLCRQDESQLLLHLKKQLPPDEPEFYYKTKYWKEGSDCCHWDGVTCDHFTGHVIALDLSSSRLFEDENISSLHGELNSNSSLFHLTRLQSLDLFFIDFSGSAIPSEFGRLNALTHLNLSNTNLAGEIPMEFYHLSNMVSLDLSTLTFIPFQEGLPACECDVKMLLGNMTRLRVLLLTNNILTSELPMNMSSFLTQLDLQHTGLRGKLPSTIFEKPNLQILKLSGNDGLKGSLPNTLNWSNVHSLEILDLSETSISGTLPDSIGLMTSLNYMDLSLTSISGRLPDSVGFMTSLNTMHLSSCKFFGPIPSSLYNMSQLTSLDISSNALTGPFPSRAGHGLQHLRYMDFSNNSIQGMIPPWLFSLPSLERLYLSSNRLVGGIRKLNSKTLYSLDLRSNRLNIEFKSFNNLTNLDTLKISFNTVAVTEQDGDYVTFPNLRVLEMSTCNITEWPNLSRSSLQFLDLSDNKIKGLIPTWFSSNPPLDLYYLDLHANSIRGTFPSSICNMTRLSILNLSNNKLSGNIPECLANSSGSLVLLDLRRNEFHGKIPTTIGNIYGLTYLGLNGNHLEGALPPSLANCTGLQVIDLGNNMLRDTFPWWLHSLSYLKILILKSNSFHGSITSPAFTNISFTNLQILDLSYNNFTGLLPEKLFASLQAIKQASPDDGLYMMAESYEYSVEGVLETFTTIDLSSNNFYSSIPDSLSNLTSLRLLNLSHNSIHGSIPPALGRMTELEQLDLSRNQLTGGIPQTLTNLTFLADLNLSFNHLVGPIPQSTQFSTFSNSSYAGNSGLCGAPLTRICGNERQPPSTGGEDHGAR